MSFSTQDSAIRMTPALQEEINNALPDQIKAIMARAALEQALVTPDPYNPSLLHPTELADHAPRKFAKHVTLNGTKYLLEGGSPEELANAETALYQQIFEKGDNGQARDAQGRFVAEPTAAEKAAGELEASNRADLELKFKRGDITSVQYLEESGAITEYLENHGVNPDALVAVSDLVAQNTWAQATEAFLGSDEGADWPGGQENLAIAARLLEENGLTGQPSAETLAAVWKYMRENDLAIENPEVTQHQQIADATSVEQIREAMGRPSSSGLFDRR
jgi:hypothetical protein